MGAIAQIGGVAGKALTPIPVVGPILGGIVSGASAIGEAIASLVGANRPPDYVGDAFDADVARLRASGWVHLWDHSPETWALCVRLDHQYLYPVFPALGTAGAEWRREDRWWADSLNPSWWVAFAEMDQRWYNDVFNPGLRFLGLDPHDYPTAIAQAHGVALAINVHSRNVFVLWTSKPLAGSLPGSDLDAIKSGWVPAASNRYNLATRIYLQLRGVL